MMIGDLFIFQVSRWSIAFDWQRTIEKNWEEIKAEKIFHSSLFDHFVQRMTDRWQWKELNQCQTSRLTRANPSDVQGQSLFVLSRFSTESLCRKQIVRRSEDLCGNDLFAFLRTKINERLCSSQNRCEEKRLTVSLTISSCSSSRTSAKRPASLSLSLSLSLSMIVFTLSMLRRDLHQKKLGDEENSKESEMKWNEKGGAKILFDVICPNSCCSVWCELERFSIPFVPVECLLLPNWVSPIGDWFVLIDVRVTHFAVLLLDWESFIRSIHFPRQSVEKREREREIDLGRSTIDGMDRRWTICRRTDFHSSLVRASPLVDEWGWNVFLHFLDGQLFDLVKNGRKRLSDVDSNLELNSRRETGEKKFFETLLILFVDKRFHRWWMKLKRRNGWIDWKGQRMFLFPVLFTDVDETVRMRFFFRIDRKEEIRRRNESFLDLPLLDEKKSVLSMRCQLNGKITQSITRLPSSWSSRRVVPFDVHRREVRSIENSSLELRRLQWNGGRGVKRTSSISIGSTEFRCCRVKRDSNEHDRHYQEEWQSNGSRSSASTPPLE